MSLSIHCFVLSTLLSVPISLYVCLPGHTHVYVVYLGQICVYCSGNSDVSRWGKGLGVGSGVSPSQSRVSRSKGVHLLKVAQ